MGANPSPIAELTVPRCVPSVGAKRATRWRRCFAPFTTRFEICPSAGASPLVRIGVCAPPPTLSAWPLLSRLAMVNHHIGLSLSVADCIAFASEDGEFLFFQILLSCSPYLSSPSETEDGNGARNEHCLQTIPDAVRSRCASLVTTNCSVAVQVHSHWWCERTFETIMMICKYADRSTVTSVAREVLQVHETIVTKTATYLWRTTAFVIEHVTGEMLHFK